MCEFYVNYTFDLIKIFNQIKFSNKKIKNSPKNINIKRILKFIQLVTFHESTNNKRK